MNQHDALIQSIALTQEVIDAGPLTDELLDRPTPCAAFDVRALEEHLLDTHDASRSA
jgi:hypothetical protein